MNTDRVRCRQLGLFEELMKHGGVPSERSILNDLDRTSESPLFSGVERRGQRLMFHVLKCVALRDPELGYCQGMNWIAASFLEVVCYSRDRRSNDGKVDGKEDTKQGRPLPPTPKIRPLPPKPKSKDVVTRSLPRRPLPPPPVRGVRRWISRISLLHNARKSLKNQRSNTGTILTERKLQDTTTIECTCEIIPETFQRQKHFDIFLTLERLTEWEDESHWKQTGMVVFNASSEYSIRYPISVLGISLLVCVSGESSLMVCEKESLHLKARNGSRTCGY